jgi:Ran GTPase-activating protein (RanGAP) involved in mRNA processing and transport
LRRIKTGYCTRRNQITETLSTSLQTYCRIVELYAALLSTMSDNGNFSDVDSDVDEHFQDHYYHVDSENDNSDNGCDEYGDDDDGDEDEDDLFVSRLCARLRSNDPSVVPEEPSDYFEPDVRDSRRLEIAEALAQNTIVRRIGLDANNYENLSADAMAKFLAQSKHLLAVKLSVDFSFGTAEECAHQQFLSTFIEAIGRSNSAKELELTCPGLILTSKSLENMLIRTKTIQSLTVYVKRQGHLEEAAIDAIASGFTKNATLREIIMVDWQETSLVRVLTALQDHPVLETLQVEGISSLEGINALLGSNNSLLKQLIIARFNGSIGEQIIGFETFMLEMGRNATILKLAIAHVRLRRDSIQQLKAMLRRNTVLQYLDLTGDALGSTGLAEIASALYRNTSIQSLNVSGNGLNDLASANTLRVLLRRNKTITELFMNRNFFGNNVAAVRCIADGFRVNTALQVLHLSSSALYDEGLSIIAECLGQQKRGLVNLDLSANHITCSGIRALVDNATVALSTLTHLNLCNNSLLDEGATFLAETLRLETLPSLKCLWLFNCHISDDGLAALMSVLTENETFEAVNLEDNDFSVRGYLALASSLPNIKGLRQLDFSLTNPDPSVMPALLEGFRKNTSLQKVNITGCEPGKWSQDLSFILYRNKFSRLLLDSDTDDRESLGLWSRALGSVATRPDVLFHVLTSKAGLIRATSGENSKKRKRDGSE